MKRTGPQLAIPNFARDTRPQVRMIATVLLALSTLILAAALWLVFDRQALMAQTAAMTQIGTRLAAKRDALRAGPVKMPPADEFERLRGRIDALNRLDFDASASAGDLLDAIEAILPDHVVITSLDYDRAAHSIDLAAISASSEELTSFFDALDRAGMFSQVRLVDKLQIEAQTQVRIALQVGRQSAPRTAQAARS